MTVATQFPALDRLTLVENFGHSISSTAYLYRPTHVEQIADLLDRATQNGFTIGLRGSGRSYGDASLNGGQVVLDLRRMNRVLAWNPDTGVITVEPGVTIQQLWQYTVEDGWWPPVVSGTMFPTLAGALAMNIHGKNNYRAGPLGEHVLEFTALLPTGEHITCTPETPDLFYSLISGIGVLGVFTSITLQMKRIYSGNIKVHAWSSPNLKTMMADFEPLKGEADYLVGWVEGMWGAGGLGKGQTHAAYYPHAGEDSAPAQTLRLDYQQLPDTFFGIVPKSILYRFMRPFSNNLAWGMVSQVKYLSARFLEEQQHFVQSLVAFNFLLDFVPNWERAYGSGGLIQFQSFIPKDTALDGFNEILTLTQKQGMPSYATVLKRHRPDKFLLSHAVDGYSLAMDLRVTDGNRVRLKQMCDTLSEIVLQAGGRFYLAKDSMINPDHARRYLGEATLQKFKALKQQVDPQGVLQTEMYRRIFV